MPRTSRKKSLLDTQKQPLLFLEPPLDGARHHDVPSVRGALYPKSFVTEKQGQTSNNTASTSWVSPQFDHAHLHAAPVRRGGRRLQTTSISDRSGQLSRKTRVSKYPTLSFENKTVTLTNQLKKRAADTVAAGREIPTSRPVRRAVPDDETPKRRPASLRRTTAEGTRSSSLATPEGATTASRSGFEHRRRPASNAAAGHNNKIHGCSSSVTPGSANRHAPPDAPNVFTPPDVETPDPTTTASSSTSCLRLLLPASQPSTPLGQSPDTLVADTPERDYGLKVTWRRRKGLMRLLIGRGQLPSSDAQISI